MDERLDQLQRIGFTVAGSWQMENNKLTVSLDERYQTQRNVLYAFVVTGRLMYIGKTVKTLAKRMYGYKLGHRSQATNERNHKRLCDCLRRKESVQVLVLPDNGLLHYGDFHINLAAGLEDSLINKLRPEWNRGKKETENETLKPTVSASRKELE